MNTIEPRDSEDGSSITPIKTQTHIKIIFIISIIVIILVIVIVIVTVLSNKNKNPISNTDKPPNDEDTSPGRNLNDLKRKRKERREKFNKMNTNIEKEEQSEQNLQPPKDHITHSQPVDKHKPNIKPRVVDTSSQHANIPHQHATTHQQSVYKQPSDSSNIIVPVESHVQQPNSIVDDDDDDDELPGLNIDHIIDKSKNDDGEELINEFMSTNIHDHD